MPAPSCWICLSRVYVKRVRTWKCPECDSISHMKCLIEYLTISNFNQLYCPTCKRIFTSQDLREILNKTDYHTYLDKVINTEFEYFISSNMSRVNETIYYRNLWSRIKTNWRKRYQIQSIAEKCFELPDRYKTYIEDEEYVDVLKSMREKGFSITTLKRSDDCYIHPSIYQKVFADDEDFKQFKDMPSYIGRHIFLNVAYNDAVMHAVMHAEKSDVQRPLMNCTKCNGLVVTYNGRAYCSECLVNYCIKCGEEITEDGHECDEEKVESFKLIKSVTKPCPKCGVRIQRSEGCSQMFCTHCHTGFDWNTGSLITYNFHNPHRIAWLRTLETNSEEEQTTCCNIQDRIRQLERSRYKHIQQFSQFIGALRSATNNFNRNDIAVESTIYHLLCKNKPIKSVVKTYAGANYISQEYGEVISMFIDSAVSIYIHYTGTESDRLILEMLTSLMTDIYRYGVDISKRSVEKFFHPDYWLQYIVKWYKYMPLKDDIELSSIYTEFSRRYSHRTIRDEMMEGQ